jgi:transcriptional regulator with XRE-family HTH domain
MRYAKYQKELRNMLFLSTRLKELRLEKRMTQAQVAARVGVTRSMVSCYETDIKSPGFDVLLRFARLYGVSIDYLLSMEERRYIDISELDEGEVAIIKALVNQFMLTKAGNSSTGLKEVIAV